MHTITREQELTLSGVLKISTPGSSHLPLTEALQISLQVVRLVAETHDRGQVVGVLDAAHLICNSGGHLTVSGRGGNPIAPELKRGEMPDRLTDVYALGALMYRLLTGRRVEPSRVIQPPSHFNPAVDSGLDELVLCALDEDPSERPYSARDLEQRLLGVYDDLGLEDSRTEATKLIASAKKPPRLPVSDAAPASAKRPAYVPAPRVVDPDGTVDGDDDDDWQPQLDRNPLEKKWLLGTVVVLALFLAAFLAWPAEKNEQAPAAADDVAPAKVMKSEPKVEAKLVVPEAPKAQKPAKKSTRRARR